MLEAAEIAEWSTCVRVEEEHVRRIYTGMTRPIFGSRLIAQISRPRHSFPHTDGSKIKVTKALRNLPAFLRVSSYRLARFLLTLRAKGFVKIRPSMTLCFITCFSPSADTYYVMDKSSQYGCGRLRLPGIGSVRCDWALKWRVPRRMALTMNVCRRPKGAIRHTGAQRRKKSS